MNKILIILAFILFSATIQAQKVIRPLYDPYSINWEVFETGINTYYVDPNGNDITGTGNYFLPFATIQKAMQVINADAAALALAGNYPASKYVVKIAPGTYSDSIVINNEKYLRFEMPGVIISGHIDINTTQQTGDYYSKIEFWGGMSPYPEKGDNGEISGVINCTRNNDALIYLSFSGMEISNNLLCTNNGTWVILCNNTFFSGSSKYVSGNFTGGGTPCILLITQGQTEFNAHICNTDNSQTTVALYDCMNTSFDLINTSMAYGGILRNCTFKSNVTIASGTYKIDNVSYKQIISQTENLTGTTIQYLDDTFGANILLKSVPITTES